MTKDQIDSLADRIAKMISVESPGDPGAVQQSLDAINLRLEKLESSPLKSDFQSKVLYPVHPSQDRFAIAEAIADSLFEQSSPEKACTFEPSKPCDHCSMCSSRGF